MLLSVTEFIGRFHPVVVHLPIGILLLALLLQFLSRKEQYTLSFGVMKIVWLLGMLSAILACITGYLLSVSGDYEGGTVALHMWLGIGVAFVSMLVCAKVFSRQFDATYKAASLLLLLLIMAAGHFGGALTHGSDYLTSALYKLPDEPVAAKPIANVQEADVYTDVVQPVLQSKCYSCHGAQKQKGKLRLDDSLAIRKGGKNGPVLEGNAEESELIRRLLLPRADEHHMPPKEKPQLSKQQVALLHWWVDQGAPFHQQVKNLEQPETIKPLLAALEKGEPEIKAPAYLPEAPVAAADEKAIEALKEKGVVVMPVAQNSNYLMASFVTTPDFGDGDAALLLPLKQQLVWLKMGDTKIGDPSLEVLAQCPNLTLLQLNGTQITDKGLLALKALRRLQLLNLVGTKVSVQGVQQLGSLTELQSLYLFQTGLRQQDLALLKKQFPKTKLDMGAYQLPLLASDTTLVE